MRWKCSSRVIGSGSCSSASAAMQRSLQRNLCTAKFLFLRPPRRFRAVGHASGLVPPAASAATRRLRGRRDGRPEKPVSFPVDQLAPRPAGAPEGGADRTPVARLERRRHVRQHPRPAGEALPFERTMSHAHLHRPPHIHWLGQGAGRVVPSEGSPFEVTNLLGGPAHRARYRSQADAMKDRLLAWLGRAGSPLAAGIREREFTCR